MDVLLILRLNVTLVLTWNYFLYYKSNIELCLVNTTNYQHLKKIYLLLRWYHLSHWLNPISIFFFFGWVGDVNPTYNLLTCRQVHRLFYLLHCKRDIELCLVVNATKYQHLKEMYHLLGLFHQCHWFILTLIPVCLQMNNWYVGFTSPSQPKI